MKASILTGLLLIGLAQASDLHKSFQEENADPARTAHCALGLLTSAASNNYLQLIFESEPDDLLKNPTPQPFCYTNHNSICLSYDPKEGHPLLHLWTEFGTFFGQLQTADAEAKTTPHFFLEYFFKNSWKYKIIFQEPCFDKMPLYTSANLMEQPVHHRVHVIKALTDDKGATHQLTTKFSLTTVHIPNHKTAQERILKKEFFMAKYND